MSWVQQGNKLYYYHSYRQDKKVITEYWGKDEKITHLRIACHHYHNDSYPDVKQADDTLLAIAQDIYSKLYAPVDFASQHINTLLKRVLIFTGHYIDHKGMWRKAQIKTVSSKRYKMMVKDYIEKDKSVNHSNIIVENPVKELLRQSILHNTEIWKQAESLSEVTLMDLITRCCPSDDWKNYACELVEQEKQWLGYEKASRLERLLIDAIILTELKLAFIERNIAIDLKYDPNKSTKYWEKKQNQAFNQHLRACKALARVKKLAKNCPELKD